MDDSGRVVWTTKRCGSPVAPAASAVFCVDALGKPVGAGIEGEGGAEVSAAGAKALPGVRMGMPYPMYVRRGVEEAGSKVGLTLRAEAALSPRIWLEAFLLRAAFYLKNGNPNFSRILKNQKAF